MATISQATRIERAYNRLRTVMAEWMETAACPEKEFDEMAALWHEVEQRMDGIVEHIQWNEAFNPPSTDEKDLAEPNQ